MGYHTEVPVRGFVHNSAIAALFFSMPKSQKNVCITKEKNNNSYNQSVQYSSRSFAASLLSHVSSRAHLGTLVSSRAHLGALMALFFRLGRILSSSSSHSIVVVVVVVASIVVIAPLPHHQLLLLLPPPPRSPQSRESSARSARKTPASRESVVPIHFHTHTR